MKEQFGLYAAGQTKRGQMKRDEALHRIAELRKEIQLCETRKLEVIKAVESLRAQYYQGLLTENDYKERVLRALQGRTARELTDEYSSIIRKNKQEIFRIEDSIPKFNVNSKHVIIAVLLILTLLAGIAVVNIDSLDLNLSATGFA